MSFSILYKSLAGMLTCVIIDCAAAWPDSSEAVLSTPVSMASRSLLDTWPQLLSCNRLFFASALLLLRTIAQVLFCYMIA